MELRYGGKLEVGDPILVSYTHRIYFGIFAGFGNGTIQYYMPNHVVSVAEYAQQHGHMKFFKSYVYGSNVKNRVAKITPDLITNQGEREEYEKAIDILKQENIVK